MDALLMLKTAIVLLGVAAVGGLAMAAIRLSRKANPPVALAMLHGMLAAAALALLAYAAFAAGVPRSALIALVLLLAAAAGGAVLNLGYQWKQRLLSVPLMLGHAALAVLGFVFLLVAAFGH